MEYSKYRAGFTIIELVVVLAITVTMLVAVISSFSRRGSNLNQVVALVVSDIRNAQSSAVAAKTLSDGTLRCGYGIRYVNATTYQLYAGANSATVNCASENRGYGVGDVIVATYTIQNANFEFDASFNDFFFEPPDPKTYLCRSAGGCLAGVCDSNCALLSLPHLTVTVSKVGVSCPGVDCKNINVHASGKVEIQ